MEDEVITLKISKRDLDVIKAGLENLEREYWEFSSKSRFNEQSVYNIQEEVAMLLAKLRAK